MGRKKIVIAAVILAVVAGFSGCRRYNVPPVVVAEVRSLPSEILVPAPEPVIVLPPYDSSLSIYKGLNREVSVIEFYKQMDNYPVWINSSLRVGLADSMVQFIRNIRYYGLLPQNYHERELTATTYYGSNTERILRRDVLLTDAFLSIAKDLRSGMLRCQTGKDDSLQRMLLAAVVTNGALREYLDSQEPQVAAYQSLKRGLHVLLDTMDRQERAFLLAGVTIDSIAAHKQTQFLEINMERWRWEKFPVKRYIIINIPAFMARVFAEDTLVLESRVIVGKPDHPTPQLSSNIQCFITYPYWHVPRKIATDELLPMIQRDRGYIARNNFDVLDKRGNLLNPDSVEWEKFTNYNFPVTLRQREGVDNSLGILKFVFDNPFAVFLHDTNARRLFQSKTRAYSHGCVRMEKAVDFAHYLVTGNLQTRSTTLDKLLQEEQRHTVEVANPIDIHVRYFTAEVNGEQRFLYHDFYKKDRALIDSLYYRQLTYY